MKEYRLVMQYKNPKGRFINKDIVISGEIKEPKEILDLGLRHKEQIEILQKIQDSVLNVPLGDIKSLAFQAKGR